MTPAEFVASIPPTLPLLLVALPVAVWVAVSDMRDMRIPNRAVVTLVVGFAVVGLLTLPLSDWLWRWSHLAIVLVAGMALNAARMVGAGDAKFAAAAAPFVAPGDWLLVLAIFAASLLAAWAGHRIAMHSPVRQLAPAWKSWDSGERFPMGLALAGTLVTYLAIGLTG